MALFMESRLRIAWQLLKSDGVIFISIDDFEMGALRMLCDDVFGEAFSCAISYGRNAIPEKIVKRLAMHTSIFLCMPRIS